MRYRDDLRNQLDEIAVQKEQQKLRDEKLAADSMVYQKNLDQRKAEREQAKVIAQRNEIIRLQREGLAEKKAAKEYEAQNRERQQQEFRNNALKMLQEQKDQEQQKK